MNRTRRGFTLIELMIVVAIVGILAAIAIPNFLAFQLRSRAGEGKTNLAAIRIAQGGYASEFDTYVPAAILPRPLAALDRDRFAWPTPAAGFDEVGWGPEGGVLFSYQVSAGPPGCPAAGLPCNHYTAEAASDLDDDGTFNWWGYVKPNEVGTAVAGTGCADTGAWNPISMAKDLRESVGPCDDGFGLSVF